MDYTDVLRTAEQTVAGLREHALNYVGRNRTVALADLLTELQTTGVSDAYVSRAISGLLVSDVLTVAPGRPIRIRLAEAEK